MNQGCELPELSLVICTLDEADAIGPVLHECVGALGPIPFEIIVVDDSADERTGDVVRAHALSDPRIRLVRRSGARGLASAAISGWDAARGRLLAIMDGDGQHDPAVLPWLLDSLDEASADLALGSRYTTDGRTGLSPIRDAMSRLATMATQLALGAPASDPMSGFFVMTRDWYEAVRPRLSGLGFKILADVLASGRRRPRVTEVATSLRTRLGGESKLDFRVIADLFALLVEKRTGGLVSSRFALFAGVGATGVLVHVTALLSLTAAGAPFWAAQAGATLTAMTSNFFFNNALTFRDVRLKGSALARGLMAFCLACSGGAVISELAATGLHGAGMPAIAAGVMGAASAAVWNYWASKRSAWASKTKTTVEAAAAAEPVERALDKAA